MREKITLRYLTLSNACEAFSGSIFSIILTLLLVNSLGITGTQMGILNAVPLLIFLILNIPVGRFIDQGNQLLLMKLSLFIKFCILTFFCVLAWWGVLNFVWILILISFLTISGIVIENSQFIISAKFQKNNSSTLVAQLVSTDRIANIAAPLLIASILKNSSLNFTLTLVVCIHLCAVLFSLKITIDNLIPSVLADKQKSDQAMDAEIDTEESKGGRRFLHGLKMISTYPSVFLAAIAIGVGNFGLALGDTAIPFLLLREMNMTEQLYSLTLTISSLAGLLAALLSIRFVKKIPYPKVLVFAIWCQVIAVVSWNLIPYASSLLFFLVLLAEILWGFGITFLNVSSMDYISRQVKESHLGVILASVRTISMICVPIGTLGSGFLLDTFNYHVPLVTWLILVMGLAIVVSINFRQFNASMTSDSDGQ